MLPRTVASILVGLAMIGIILHQHFKHASSERWPTTDGTVVEASAERHRSGTDRTYYTANVRYIYTVEGERYEGSRIQFREQQFRSRAQAEAYAEAWARTSPLAVRYDPEEPARSVVVPDDGSPFITAVLILAALLGMVLHVHRSLDRRPGRRHGRMIHSTVSGT